MQARWAIRAAIGLLATTAGGWAAEPEPGIAPAATPASPSPPVVAPAPAPIEYAPGRDLCRLANRTVSESSGLAASRVHEGVFWTHNDSGGAAELYAFNAKGEDLGTFKVPGENQDWEDICAFKSGGKGYLVVADTGDNARRRGQYTLYVCEEPELKPAQGGKPGGALKLVREVEFSYADGASHDGESLAAEPNGSRVYLASRDRTQPECKVFALDLDLSKDAGDAKGSKPRGGFKAREIASQKLMNVTAMDISGDGRRAVLQTYAEAHEFVRAEGQTWEQAFKGQPRVIALPARPQGEGITYGADNRTLYLTSESANGCPLYVVEPRAAVPETKPEPKPRPLP